MKQNKFVTVIFDRKKRAPKCGKGNVEIRVYLNRLERKHFIIGEATPFTWQQMAQREDVKMEMDRYQKIVDGMIALGEELTLENFNSHLDIHKTAIEVKKQSGDMFNNQDLTESFIEFIRNMQPQENVTKATMKHKRVTLRSLETFGRIQTFADLTPANIMAYDRFLHNGVRKEITVFTYHKYVRYYINILMMEERIPRNPYDRVKIKKGESEVRHPLTEEELIKVRDAVFTRPKLDRVRDLFIFMAYTGMSYADTQVFDFKKMTIFDEQTGMYFIDGKRTKTKTNVTIPNKTYLAGARFFVPLPLQNTSYYV